MPSTTFLKKPSFVAVVLGVAALTALMIGCAKNSEVAKDAASSPTTEQPQRNLMDPGRALVKVWAAPGTFDKVTHVALFGQVLYVAGMPAGIHAIDTFDGLRLWSHPCKGTLAGDIMQSGDELYLVEGRDVVKLDADNGVELMRNRTRLGVRSAIMPGPDSWVLAATDDRIWGVVPDTGRGYWRITFDDPITDMIEDGGDTLYVHTLRGTVYRASRHMREIQWKLPFPKPAASPLTLLDNRLVVGSEDYFVYEISAEDGEVLSRTCLSAPVLGTPLVAKPVFYISTSDRKLYALDTASLAVKWTLENATRALTVAGDEMIFLGNRNGESYLGVADVKTGKVVTEISARGFDFFVADPMGGVVFAVASNGNVLAIAHRAALDSLPKEPVPARAQEDPEKLAVKEVVRQICDAAKSGDMDKLLGELTPESAEFMRTLIETAGAEKARDQFSTAVLVIGKIRISGETATVQTNAVRNKKGEIKTAHMSRIGGAWKMDLVKAMEGVLGD